MIKKTGKLLYAFLMLILMISVIKLALKVENTYADCATKGVATYDRATPETATCQIASYSNSGHLLSESVIPTEKENINAEGYIFGPIEEVYTEPSVTQLNAEYKVQDYQRYFENTSGSVTTANCVLEAIEDAKADALRRYNSYYSVSISSCVKSTNIMGTYNYSQTSLNAYYKSVTGTTVDETCSLVASTILAGYYYRKGYGGTLSETNYKQIFWRMVNFGFSTGAYTYDSSNNSGGTTWSKLKNVITKYYDFYDVDLNGNYDIFNLKKTIEAYNKNLKPVIGHFQATGSKGHDMVIIGYYDITVKYKATVSATSYSTATMRYYVVNDGWHDDNSGVYRIQYINEEYLQSLTKIK